MDFDTNSFLASLLVSSIGFVAFMYGKRQGRWPQMAAGVILSVFPYFVSSVWWMFGITSIILGGLWFAVRLGW